MTGRPKLPQVDGWVLVKREKKPHGAQWWQYECDGVVVLACVASDCFILDPGWWHSELDDGTQYVCYSEWEVAEDLTAIRTLLRLGVKYNANP